MSRLKQTWLFLSGLMVCMMALVLPYRPRLLFSKVLNYLFNPPSWTASLLFQRQVAFWNRVVLGFVFYLGFPVAWLLFRLGGKGRLAPPPASPTYWAPRRPSEEFERGIRDPF